MALIPKPIALLVLIGSALVVLALTGAMIYLKAHEDELVFATSFSRADLLTAFSPEVERVAVKTADGTLLAGLVFHAGKDADGNYWVLHLHGNAVSAFTPWQVRHCEALRRAGFNVLEIDYRGFGATPGIASETAMDEDAEAAYGELLHRGVPPNRIILLGHSLGSGPAVLLATRHTAAALVLFGAFTSIPDAAAARYPYLPVRLAVGVQFNSLARIGQVHMPVVVVHSRSDTMIPYSQARQLFAAANAPKQLVSLEGASNDGMGGHVDALYDHLDVMRSVLDGLLPALPPPREL